MADERGFFARTYCQHEFAQQGLVANFVQCNLSYNSKRGTLRGMHHQSAPYAEVKLVRCTQGSIYDVIVDLRRESPSLGQWLGMELTAQNRHALYVPEGFAHGFITLEDNCEVLYQMSEFFHAECAGGVRWDDPAFGIDWPVEATVISARDQHYADWTE